MLLKQGDRVMLRSNKNVSGGLQPGDKGVVERMNADKGVVDVLWDKGVRTVHVSWPSKMGTDLFLSTDLLIALEEFEALPAHLGFYPPPKEGGEARLKALLDDMKKMELVEKTACLLASSCGNHQVLYLVWLLEVLERETNNSGVFRETLEELRDNITARLEADVWQNLSPQEASPR